MSTFDDFWQTTGPWPDNILTSAFKELAEKAWRAGKASTGLSAGVAVAFQDVISGFHGHPGKPCWLGCCETKLPLRPEIPEPQEGWDEHRARGCKSLHVDAKCPDGFGPKEHCPIRLSGRSCAIHDPKAEGMAAEARDDAQEVDHRPVCPGCESEIDPDTCGCGDAREGHGYGGGGHGFIPMGCGCFRAPATDPTCEHGEVPASCYRCYQMDVLEASRK